jgi:hypothetical protein
MILLLESTQRVRRYADTAAFWMYFTRKIAPTCDYCQRLWYSLHAADLKVVMGDKRAWVTEFKRVIMQSAPVTDGISPCTETSP